MQNLDVRKTVAWSTLEDTVFVPCIEAEYDRWVSLLDPLSNEVGDDESHPPRPTYGNYRRAHGKI